MKGAAERLRDGLAVLAAVWLMLSVASAMGAVAQESADADSATETEGNAVAEGSADTDDGAEVDEESAEATYSAEELDQLVAPIALYPDSLLAQVLVASTYPLEVVKADRWVEENQDLAEDARADAAQAEGWDESVVVLAAGFPTLIDRMEDEIDWTESLGDAVLVQSDDVLDAVQRQRARAAAAGNLESNEAQVVTEEDDNISVAPADPEVVYVPAYDPATAYATPVEGAPVIVDQSDPGYSTGALITTGVVSFGLGMLVNEVFHDDDHWDDWHGYWGSPRFDWDNDNFYPRPGINVGGDLNVNIDRDNTNIGDRGDPWRPDRDRRDEARRKIERKKGGGKGQLASLGGGKQQLGGANRSTIESKLKARSGKAGGKLQKPKQKVSLPKKKGATSKDVFSGSKNGLTKSKKAASRGKASKAKAKVPSRPKKKIATASVKKPKKGLSSRSKGKQSLFKKGGGGAKHGKRRHVARRAAARGSSTANGEEQKHEATDCLWPLGCCCGGLPGHSCC